MEIDWTATAAVIQAITAAITAVYVYLTFRLVRAQERPLLGIRLAAQESAVRSLVTLIGTKGRLVHWAARNFPIDESRHPNADGFEYHEVQSFVTDLGIATVQLPPSLFYQCNEASMRVNDASGCLLALSSSISNAGSHSREGIASNWGDVRRVFSDCAKQLHLELDWQDVVAGKPLQDACDSLAALDESLMKYLLTAPAK